jgi:hypothetical protein
VSRIIHLLKEIQEKQDKENRKQKIGLPESSAFSSFLNYLLQGQLLLSSWVNGCGSSSSESNRLTRLTTYPKTRQAKAMPVE